MPVKLNSTGGGSVTLTTPSTATDYTATFPANTGDVITTGSSDVVTPAMLSTGAPSWNSSGVLSFNSGYGSVATAYGCRAWVNFNGNGTVAIRASGNVTSITDNGAGNYTVNFTNAMPDANYSCVASVNNRDTGFIQTSTVNTFATGSVVIRSAQSNSPSGSDYDNVCVAVFR